MFDISSFIFSLSLEDNEKKIDIKKYFFIVLFFISLIVVCCYTIYNSDEKQPIPVYEKIKEADLLKKRLENLKERFKNKNDLSKQEFKELCALFEKIEYKIIQECHCDGDSSKSIFGGYNWLKPPRIEELESNSNFSEVKIDPRSSSTRRIFINEEGFKIGYDTHKDQNGNNLNPHYHIYETSEKENQKNKDDYLDECGNKVKRGRDSSHIFIKANNAQIVNLKEIFK